jgi:hypothetical protein
MYLTFVKVYTCSMTYMYFKNIFFHIISILLFQVSLFLKFSILGETTAKIKLAFKVVVIKAL